GVKIFAARLDREDFRPADALGYIPTGVLMPMLEPTSVFDVLPEIVRICKLVERASDHRLRLLPLGDNNRREGMVSTGPPDAPPDEIDVVRPLHQELSENRVIVSRLGEMTVGTRLGVGPAGKIRTWVRRPAVLRVRAFRVLGIVLHRWPAPHRMRHIRAE